MDFVASKYCNIWKIPCIWMDYFLKGNIKRNTLSTKPCFLKLNIDTPLASNLSKTATSFVKKWAKKIVVIKINIQQFQCFDYFKSTIWCTNLCFCKSSSIIICYSIITYYIIYMFRKWSRNMKKTVTILSDIALFIAKYKSFCFRRSYWSNASLFTVIVNYLSPLIQ